MEKIYIFSDNYYIIKHLNKDFYVNKNCIIKLDNILSSDLLEVSCLSTNSSIVIDLNNLASCNYYRVYNLNEQSFIYLVSTDFDNLIQKLQLDAEVFVYSNCVRLIYESYCYTYTFFGRDDTQIAKKEDYLYIYNKVNLLMFNTKNKTFILLNVENFKKINKNTEILCKIPKNFNYYLLFSFSDQTLNHFKKLQKRECKYNEKGLPYTIFYLSKFKFEDIKNLISDNINHLNLFSYFENYESIIEIERKYYLIGSNSITPVSFNILNGKITDID